MRRVKRERGRRYHFLIRVDTLLGEIVFFGRRCFLCFDCTKNTTTTHPFFIGKSNCHSDTTTFLMYLHTSAAQSGGGQRHHPSFLVHHDTSFDRLRDHKDLNAQFKRIAEYYNSKGVRVNFIPDEEIKRTVARTLYLVPGKVYAKDHLQLTKQRLQASQLPPDKKYYVDSDLSYGELNVLAKQMRKGMVLVNHGSDDPDVGSLIPTGSKYTVGHIYDVAIDSSGKSILAAIKLHNSIEGWTTCRLIQAGVLTSFSIQHSRGPGSLTFHEGSLCFLGRRAGTNIYDIRTMDYDIEDDTVPRLFQDQPTVELDSLIDAYEAHPLASIVPAKEILPIATRCKTISYFLFLCSLQLPVGEGFCIIYPKRCVLSFVSYFVLAV
jgi:hypothetical protein